MPKKKKKKTNFSRYFLFFLIIVIAVLTGGYFYKMNQKPKDLVTVRVGLAWVDQAQFAGIYTAIEEGFYQDAGLNVEIKEFDQAVSNEQLLSDGELDFTVSQPIVLINKVAEGLDIRAVAAIYQTSPLAYLYRGDLDLTNPSDFKGKKLGVKGNNLAGNILFKALLSELSLDEGEIDFKRLDFSTHEFDDIQNGVVDIIGLYRTNQPYTFRKNNASYKMIFPEDFGFNTYGDVLVSSNMMINKNPKLVQSFVDATIKGWEFASENQDKAVEHTMKYVTDSAYQDEAYNKFILEQSVSLIDVIGVNEIGFMSLDRWRELYQAMLGTGLVDNDLDIEKVFTLEFVH